MARLKVSEDEIPALVNHLERILDLVETLRSVDIPDDLVIDEKARAVVVSALREDESLSSDSPGGPRDQDSIGKNAPDWRDGTFVTPRVVG